MLQIPKPQLVLPQINNMAATPSPSVNGVSVPAPAGTNTKSGWVELFAAASVTKDVYGISLLINADLTATSISRNLYDIGIGAAASEVVKVPNILHNGGSTYVTSVGREFFIPVFIPKGTRISIRHQSNIANQAANCSAWLHCGGGLPPWATFSGVNSYGTDTATSGGVAHTCGSSGTYSSWANLGATLTKDYSAILPMIVGADTTLGSLAAHLQLGISSVEMVKYLFITTTAEAIGAIVPSLPVYHKWASGTQMMLRATASGTGDPIEVGFLAFY